MKKALKILGFIILGALFVFAFGYLTMWLWNWLVPTLFHGPVITFWQALGLLLLSKILFGGFPKEHKEKKTAWKRHWKERMKMKMEQMTPEEREKMKEQFSRCMPGRWSWQSCREDDLTEKKPD